MRIAILGFAGLVRLAGQPVAVLGEDPGNSTNCSRRRARLHGVSALSDASTEQWLSIAIAAERAGISGRLLYVEESERPHGPLVPARPVGALFLERRFHSKSR
jgi:hypothetical protein